MKHFLKYLFSLLGLNVGHSISKSELEILIQRLWPKKTNIALIRFGPNKDGGYLIPDDLNEIEACFSPGVDITSDFELDCYKRGMKIFMADKSVNGPNFSVPEENYNFLKKFIGTIDSDDTITIDTWVDTSDIKSNTDLLLQMDIEGHEYASILTISPKVMHRFRIMVIEFHDLHKLWNKEFFRLAQSVFLKILETHECVHIHPNNQCGSQTIKGIEIPVAAEFTFFRKDRITNSSYATIFPHKLDFDNVKKKSLLLPKNWYLQNT